MAESGFRMARYADDFVIPCPSHEEAEAALAMVREWIDAAGKVELAVPTTNVGRTNSLPIMGCSA